MHRPQPRRTDRVATRAALLARASARALAGLLLASTAAATLPAPVAGQSLAAHQFLTTFEQLPDAQSEWERIGGGGALVVDGPELLINDNSPSDCIGYQTLLGELHADHRITVTARMRVINNLGGQSVMIEVSRPGLEMILRLDVARLDIYERRGGREPAWLASAEVDLSVPRNLRATKLSAAEDPRESLVVEIDGAELLRVAGRGDGQLGVGRIVFGSLDYPALGASVWNWIEVSAVPVSADSGVGTEASSLGGLKARYRR